MSAEFRSKLHSCKGISRLIAILLVLVIVLSITSLIPSYLRYRTQAKAFACATALDTAKRQLAADFMLGGFENGSAEQAKELVKYVMNGWDDLCPDGGNVYIVPKGDSIMDWDVYCGLHGSDKKLCTRLNADYVMQQLEAGLLQARQEGVEYPESLPFTLHHRSHTAYLVDEPTGLRRGTRTTEGYDGIVAYYSVVGHSSFGDDSGMAEGRLWYFSYADEDYCANWNYHDTWTGDSYQGLN